MLSALTQPNYPKAALGLEKGSITALQLQKEGRKGFGIKQAAALELPEHLLNPSFTSVNIASAEEMLVMLDEVTETAGLARRKRWSVSLPSNTARSAILTLDEEPASKEEYSAVLDWKAENVFGVPSGEMRITRRKISPDAKGKTRYFATAVKLSVIDEYETLFERKNWKAGLILPRAISESNWLIGKNKEKDSLLISSQSDGFVALLLRNNEPVVVRSVICTNDERDDEIFRLLMFYRDRIGDPLSENFLEKLLVVGKDFAPARLKDITSEALGKTLDILRPEDVGLNLPVNNISFDDIAAPAGLAALGWK